MEEVYKDSDPLVSICCLAYNHEKYIRQTLNAFLMQKTDFRFEVLIHDDASTDGTQDIIRKYAKEYPEIIKPILQSENQFSKGLGSISSLYNFPRAKGKYIALCEGDDYWTDPNKLQKQISLLELDLSYNATCHKVEVVYENSVTRKTILHPIQHSDREYEKLDVVQGNIAATCSLVFRKELVCILGRITNAPAGDWLLQLYATLDGSKIYGFNDIMGVYRKHEQGIWTSESDEKRLLNNLYMMCEIFPIVDPQITSIHEYTETVARSKLNLIKLYLRKGKFMKLCKSIAKYYFKF